MQLSNSIVPFVLVMVSLTMIVNEHLHLSTIVALNVLMLIKNESFDPLRCQKLYAFFMICARFSINFLKQNVSMKHHTRSKMNANCILFYVKVCSNQSSNKIWNWYKLKFAAKLLKIRIFVSFVWHCLLCVWLQQHIIDVIVDLWFAIPKMWLNIESI